MHSRLEDSLHKLSSEQLSIAAREAIRFPEHPVKKGQVHVNVRVRLSLLSRPAQHWDRPLSVQRICKCSRYRYIRHRLDVTHSHKQPPGPLPANPTMHAPTPDTIPCCRPEYFSLRAPHTITNAHAHVIDT